MTNGVTSMTIGILTHKSIAEYQYSIISKASIKELFTTQLISNI